MKPMRAVGMLKPRLCHPPPPSQTLQHGGGESLNPHQGPHCPPTCMSQAEVTLGGTGGPALQGKNPM